MAYNNQSNKIQPNFRCVILYKTSTTFLTKPTQPCLSVFLINKHPSSLYRNWDFSSLGRLVDGDTESQCIIFWIWTYCHNHLQIISYRMIPISLFNSKYWWIYWIIMIALCRAMIQSVVRKLENSRFESMSQQKRWHLTL